MLRRKPAPVIPVPDRRSHKRIVTLKNVRNALFVAIAVLIVINIHSEMRKPREGEYGRIINRALPVETPAAKPVEVVKETAQVDEQYGADPMLLEPAVRAQFLGDTSLEPAAPQTATITPAAAAAPPRMQDSKVTVVGGPEGLAVVQEEERKLPKLGGGFGRQ